MNTGLSINDVTQFFIIHDSHSLFWNESQAPLTNIKNLVIEILEIPHPKTMTSFMDGPKKRLLYVALMSKVSKNVEPGQFAFDFESIFLSWPEGWQCTLYWLRKAPRVSPSQKTSCQEVGWPPTDEPKKRLGTRSLEAGHLKQKNAIKVQSWGKKKCWSVPR